MSEYGTKNILGTELLPCSKDPMTGFYRDGCCETGPQDRGRHIVCAVMTEKFLNYSKAQGNDLTTPRPEYQFAGLKAGDQWCLCLERWREALNADCAPQIIMDATHEIALERISLETFEKFAVIIKTE